MDVAIAGGHGKIALLVSRLLVERGDRVRGLIAIRTTAPTWSGSGPSR